MPNHRGKKQTPKRGSRRKSAPRTDEIVFNGLAIVRKVGPRATQTFIVTDRETSKHLGLRPDESDLAEWFFRQAAVVRKCLGKTRKNEVRCFNSGCPHKCHLYRTPIPIPPNGPSPEDRGENDSWVDKEGGYGYWCGCEAWDD